MIETTTPTTTITTTTERCVHGHHPTNGYGCCDADSEWDESLFDHQSGNCFLTTIKTTTTTTTTTATITQTSGNTGTTPSLICNAADLFNKGAGEKSWHCRDTAWVRNCKHQCDQGGSFFKSGATAQCFFKGAKAKNGWVFKKENLLDTCLACNTDPLESFAIGGGGTWTCTGWNKATIKCLVTCNARKLTSGNIFCSRKKAGVWQTRAEKEWTCDDPVTLPPTPPCSPDDVKAQMKKKTGYADYKVENFAFTDTKCLLSANMKCATGSNGKAMMAKKISFCCKLNKRGKSQWNFRGNPADMFDEQEDVPCRAAPKE